MLIKLAQHTQPTRYGRGQAGMSLIEVLVSMMLLSIILIAFLGFLDTFSDATKVQGNIADATENLRYSVAALVKLIRMAGTGGLPLVYQDSGGTYQHLALTTQDNVDGSGLYTYGGKIANAGTDVLIIRGVITDELFDISGSTAINLTTKKLTVPKVSPYTGKNQTLLDPVNTDGKALLVSLQTPLDITVSGGVRHYSNYRIAVASGAAATVAAGWEVSFVTDDKPSLALNPGGSFSTFNVNLGYAAGFMDELTFFISQNSSGEPALYRWTSIGTAEELIPNVANLQIALGCDTNNDGDLAAAEWFHSAANIAAPSGNDMATLREVRLSVVTRSQDPDVKLMSGDTASGAGQSADMPENASDLSSDQLVFRHRTLTVRIALRSHPRLTAT
jgi:prepilin-type N-terminal cleavage/methylation domain-containing protein